MINVVVLMIEVVGLIYESNRTYDRGGTYDI